METQPCFLLPDAPRYVIQRNSTKAANLLRSVKDQTLMPKRFGHIAISFRELRGRKGEIRTVRECLGGACTRVTPASTLSRALPLGFR